jgi:hypothetical protein
LPLATSRIPLRFELRRSPRSLQDLVAFLSEIHALRIDLYLHQSGIDTTTPAGTAMFQMMGVLAQFERTMIQERVRAGLARTKAEGTQLGRPRIDGKTEEAIRRALNKTALAFARSPPIWESVLGQSCGYWKAADRCPCIANNRLRCSFPLLRQLKTGIARSEDFAC